MRLLFKIFSFVFFNLTSNALALMSGEPALVKDYHGQIISNQVFSKMDLTGAIFDGTQLTGVTFEGCNLNKVQFKQATLTNVRFVNTNLSQVDFSNSNLLLLQFSGIGTDLSLLGAKFDMATINSAQGLVDVLNNNQTLATGISFKGAKFINVSFARAKLLDKFDFTGAVFSGPSAGFENAEFGPDVIFANAQFIGEPFVPVLRNDDLYPMGAYYSAKNGLSFYNVRINGTNFSNAMFSYVNFSGMQAREVDFKRAVFTHCKIVSCLILGDLSCTNFSDSMIKVNAFTSNDMTNSLTVSKYTSAKLTNSTLLNYIDRDPDGQIGTNIFPTGIVYGQSPALDRFDCQLRLISK